MIKLQVAVVYALPDKVFSERLELKDGATVADALSAVAIKPGFSDLALERVAVGVFGQLCDRDHRLSSGDRVEIYRPLQQDAKSARRQRVSDDARSAAKPRG